MFASALSSCAGGYCLQPLLNGARCLRGMDMALESHNKLQMFSMIHAGVQGH